MNDEQKRIYEITYAKALDVLAPRYGDLGMAVQQAADAALAAADLYPDGKALSKTAKTTTKDK